jgi:hypothetical protein
VRVIIAPVNDNEGDPAILGGLLAALPQMALQKTSASLAHKFSNGHTAHDF